MAPCQYCGREMQFVQEYNQYYCQFCQQYQQAAPQAAPPQQQPYYQQPYPYSPPPSSKPKSKTPIIIIGVVIIALLIVAAAYFLVLSPSKDDNDGDAISMNMNDLENDMTYSSQPGFEFKSLEPGDTLIIEDKIVFIASEWDYWEDETVTYFWFESLHKYESEYMWYDYYWDEYYNYDLTFKGDLTDDFEEGDTVKITLHVIQVNIYGYSIETFEEMWDGYDFRNLPKSCIKFISSGNVDDYVVARFPKVEVDIDHSRSTDRILIKHIDGDPLDWTKYKMIITNASDSADQAALTSLSGEITAGQTTAFRNTTYTAMNDVKFQVGGGYDIEIYNLKENKRELLAENVICTSA